MRLVVPAMLTSEANADAKFLGGALLTLRNRSALLKMAEAARALAKPQAAANIADVCLQVAA